MNSILHSLCFTSILIAVFSIHMQFISGGVNHLTFERLQCFSNPSSGASITKCVAKLISRDHLRVNMQAILNQTVESAFVHYTVYYKFSNNEYRQFAVNGVEDFCGYMRGDPGKNIVISRVYPDYIPYTNINHTCPYTAGHYSIKISNLSIDSTAPLILVPSGRYRLEISVHNGFNGPMLGKLHLYGSVSDHRVERF